MEVMYAWWWWFVGQAQSGSIYQAGELSRANRRARWRCREQELIMKSSPKVRFVASGDSLSDEQFNVDR